MKEEKINQYEIKLKQNNEIRKMNKKEKESEDKKHLSFHNLISKAIDMEGVLPEIAEQFKGFISNNFKIILRCDWSIFRYS